MKIYTKTGDAGRTGLFAGARVSKNHPRIEAYGTVDELNATIGLTRAFTPPAGMDGLLETIQHGLFAVGAELATPDPQAHGTALVSETTIAALEAAIDENEATLPPLRQFILPTGTTLAASLHVARGVCRRAERCFVTLHESEPDISLVTLRYLNRLSDLLFVLARVANHESGISDTGWQKPAAR
jgi:cob(I)alamin adenosyltransferase